ncbi:MAG: hypothetical protein QNK42_03505 [Pseudodonghicola sp.]|nr:hypothetical protein [Pseudodonghicola sp.]
MASRPTDTDKTKPAADREDRLKAALKANMAKRKAQARARAEIVAETGPETGTGGAADKAGKSEG